MSTNSLPLASSGHGDIVEMTDRNTTTEHAAPHSTNHSTAKEFLTAIKGVNHAEDDSLDEQDTERRMTKSTYEDAAGMRRMGKEQQLVRNFRFLSICSFVAIATASWELGIFQVTPGLVDGGRSGLLYNVMWNFFAFGPIYLSLAEMASIAPIAGAQYHWVSEFAPSNSQRALSYISGWTSTIAWQAGNALGIFVVGSVVQTIILINNEDYGFPSWQGTLLAFGAMAIAYVGSVYFNRALPFWQNAVFAVHVLAYFAFLVPIWVNAPVASHSQVWGEFSNSGGWSNMGLAVLVGQLSGISNISGIDGAAHMSEEVRSASSTIPKTMMLVYFLNMALTFPAYVTICYHIPDLDAALNDTTTYPAIYVLRQSMSVGWITVILAIIVLLNVASNIAYLTAVTRDLFAFARDGGLPMSKWLSTIHPKRRIPVNAAIVSCVLAGLLALIYIGSPVAFYAMTSLCTVAVLQCYSLSIACILWRRVAYPETIPPHSFDLGRWGVPLNAFAVLYGTWSFFWCFWPQTTPVTAAGFNWASPIFVGVLLIAAVDFTFRGRKVYKGPVTEVEGRN